MPTTYPLVAHNLFDSLNIKSLRSILGGKMVDSSPQELHLQFGENSYLSVYRFGCLVFFNMSAELIEAETQKLKAAMGTGLSYPTTESYQVVVGDTLPINVEFEYVELKKLTVDHLRLINITIAQSAALEYFEIRVDRMLYETSNFMENLSKAGRVPMPSRKMIKIIGSTASTRQNIISNVAILDPPEQTWKSKELEKLHRELEQNFDLEIRYRTLDRKLTVIQNNIEILADLASSRRATILEASIVLLIVFEILMTLFRMPH